MKRLLISISFIYLFCGIASALDNNHVPGKELMSVTDGYAVGLSFRHGKNVIMPHQGDNNISLIITDPSGKALTGAKVSLSYSMPDMPKFVSKADTTYSDGSYNTVIDLNMKGTWDIDVKIISSDGKIKKVRFTIKI